MRANLLVFFIVFVCLSLGMSVVSAQNHAQPFDQDDAWKKLSKTTEQVKAPVRLTKSITDPEVSRSYNATKSIVVVETRSGAVTSHPYVPVPILFQVGSDELLDSTSKENVRKLAEILRKIHAAEPKVSFQIEGHASAEGDAEKNLALSDKRARKIHDLLVDFLSVDRGILISEGFGETFARFPDHAPESQRQQDRRVLVVRKF